MYEYNCIVDGVWCCEPGVVDQDYAAEDTVPNASVPNRVIEVE